MLVLLESSRVAHHYPVGFLPEGGPFFLFQVQLKMKLLLQDFMSSFGCGVTPHKWACLYAKRHSLTFHKFFSKMLARLTNKWEISHAGFIILN